MAGLPSPGLGVQFVAMYAYKGLLIFRCIHIMWHVLNRYRKTCSKQVARIAAVFLVVTVERLKGVMSQHSPLPHSTPARRVSVGAVAPLRGVAAQFSSCLVTVLFRSAADMTRPDGRCRHDPTGPSGASAVGGRQRRLADQSPPPLCSSVRCSFSAAAQTRPLRNGNHLYDGPDALPLNAWVA